MKVFTSQELVDDARAYLSIQQQYIEMHTRYMHEPGRDIDSRDFHAKRKQEHTEQLMHARKIYWHAKSM